MLLFQLTWLWVDERSSTLLGFESEGLEAFILIASMGNADSGYKLRSAPEAPSIDRSEKGGLDKASPGVDVAWCQTYPMEVYSGISMTVPASQLLTYKNILYL